MIGDNTFVLLLLLSPAFACDTTTLTATRDPTNVTTISINSEVGLTVTVVEAEAFVATVSFYGRDNVNTLFSDLYDENTWTWSLTIGSSAPTDPPSSSANSQIFFSAATRDALFGVTPAFLLGTMALAQCTESAQLELALPAGWEVTSEAAQAVSLGYSGPHSYAYQMVITFPSETVSTWSSEDEAAFLQDLISFYNDDQLTFIISSRVDVSGQLTLTVEIVGFPTSSSAEESYSSVSANGLTLQSSAFADITTIASAPALGCSAGFELDSAGADCIIRDCGVPIASTGYVVGTGFWTTYGSTFSMTCDTGYSGTAATLTCQSDGTWTNASGCSLDCSSSPTQTGYTIDTGSSAQGATRSATCAAGYSGSASVITCSTSSTWSASSGCTIVGCSSSPTQTGYTIAAGASTYGSARTTSCSAGYSGSGSAVTCQASGSWTSATGCSAVACPSNSAGVNVPTGCSCSTGYSGTITASTNSPYYTGSCVSSATPTVFSYTGSVQYYTVPTGVTQVTAYMWGAAGGGSSAEGYSWPGGPGGYASGVINVQGLSRLAIYVGQGGALTVSGSNPAASWPGSLSHASSGKGGRRSGYTTGYGGGRSEIRTESGSSIMIAGAGGGAAGTGWAGSCGTQSTAGGAGGGDVAQWGGCACIANSGGSYAAPGTQSAGGTGGGQASTVNAGRGYGGSCDGAFEAGQCNPNGGGGDGYYGGASGYLHCGGGGGSGYINTAYVTNGANERAGMPATSSSPPTNPPFVNHRHYASGVGVSANNAAGGNGRVVIVSAAPTIQTFTSSGTWTVPSGVTSIDVTIVGGGGCGGGDVGGG